MSSLLFCRVCLAYDVRMHSISNTELQLVYEKLCGHTLESENQSAMVCYICRSQLRRSYQLMQRALKAEELLNQIISAGNEISNVTTIDGKANGLTSGLSMSPIVHLTPEDRYSEVKQEPKEFSKQDFKLEQDSKDKSESKDQYSDVDNNDGSISSDSEDDVPLKSIRAKMNLNTAKSTGTPGKAQRKPYAKGLNINAREIILTQEEQVRDLLNRAKSLNYLNSPYKCDMCYKGFVDARAYANHKEKHDERSGPFACSVCGLRYRAPRLLRSHAAAAHSRLYQCNRCPHTAHTANQAREHDKWHNGHVYECQLCSQQFRKPTSYFTHMRMRHPTEHVCELCGAAFVGGHGLLMHKSKAHRRQTKHEEKPDEPASERFCVECNIQFATLEAWKRHIISSIKHTLDNEDGSQCRICSADISAESASAHMKRHEKDLRAPRAAPPRGGLAPLACDQCGAAFVNRSKLQAHVRRVHLGLKYNKNIVCELCGKKCTSNATLKYHQRTHTGERPHACGSCGKSFASTNLLRIHARTHSGERPYCCALCGKRFSQKAALNRHYRVHTGAKPYECQYCSKTFSQSNSVKLHVRAVHLKLPPINKKTKAVNSTNDVVLQEKSEETVLTQNS